MREGAQVIAGEQTLGNRELMHGLNNRGAHRIVHNGTHLEIHRERNV